MAGGDPPRAGSKIHLGYEIGTGEPISIPLRHLAVTGQTQESGKTTTLEALISRGEGLRAIAFVTKRAEGRFRGGQRVQPYFRERADWRFLASVLEATMRERLKFERPWIMRAAKGAKTLADVQRNVTELMGKSKRGMDADQYMKLDEYLKIVVPQIARLPFTDALKLHPGLNVMDLADYTMELQALVIRSVLEWVYERENGVVVIIPEAWEFIPQQRGSPVLLAAEELIRKGAAARNYVWLDSQDIASVHKAILRSVVVWILGVQREANEVKRMLAHITAPKPKVADVMQLGRGEFFACWGNQVRRVYVQPAWMDEESALAVAAGDSEAYAEALDMGAREREDADMDAQERAAYERQIQAAEDAARAAQQKATLLAREILDYKETIEELNRQRSLAEQDAASAEQLAAEVEALRPDALQYRDVQAGLTVLLAALRLPLPGQVRVDRAAPYLDEDALIRNVADEVLRRLPAAGGSIITVAPAEALAKDFQRAEAERIVDTLRSLPPRPRSAVLLLESRGQWITQSALADRLSIPTRGESWIKFTGALKELIEAGFIEKDSKQGIRGGIRAKVRADLQYYGPTEDELERVYQHCLATLAADAVGAPA